MSDESPLADCRLPYIFDTCRWHVREVGHEDRPTRSVADALVVYTDGCGEVRLGQTHFHVEAPAALLLPRSATVDNLAPTGLEGVWCSFDSRGLVEGARDEGKVAVYLWVSRVEVPRMKEVSRDQATGLRSALVAMGDSRYWYPPGRLDRIALLLRAIATYCEAGASEPGAAHREVVRLRHLIEERAFHPVPMGDIYRELALSRTHLATLFRKHFGTTPAAYRTRLRMHRARELLRSLQLNVSETAYAVGYTDPLYFSRLFRREFGVSPSALITGSLG